jgi:hypothetical protein
MSLPTPTALKTLDYSVQGQPFCWVAAKSSITLAGMDYSFQAQPMVANEGGVTPTTSIKKVSGVAYASIKKVCGIPIASIKKVAGVPNS